MNWLILIVAGLLEVVWATGLKFTAGFTKPIPSVITLIAMAGSFYLLSLAMRDLPLGTAYAVWVGIGITGTAIASIILFNEPLSMIKVLGVLLIMTGIIFLK